MTDRNSATPRTTRRTDYRPPAFLVDRVTLRFELDPAATRVHSTLEVRRNPASGAPGGPLVLDGQDLVLEVIAVDGSPLAPGDYTAAAEHLTIHRLPDACTITLGTRIAPEGNTALEGLYLSNGMFCTQCEAEGFRRITYYLDRPDVMAVFTTTLVADPARYPVLLANGNRVESGTLDDGRHWATWADPFPKPCYLFALVAGDLAEIEDHYVTRSGRRVAIRFYTEHANRDDCGHAIASLKQAMAWDEDTFGLEYDLDVYMVVAVDHFNMGAMENKGLNVFNSKYVLAAPETATDGDFIHVQGVIGHEYFHNWTGNRVTCRDWFQLSLKEGLTVFRDQEFTADLNSRAVKRIEDVRRLRSAQFAEDAGPMAHPVRPDAYIEINNFYTLTVYEKGAEVVRMLHTLLGAAGFRRGMDLYFQRHDGHAVTCDDFVAAMADANGADLTQFRLWYSQAGTPVLTVEDDYDPAARRYTLRVRQSCPPTPGQAEKAPMHIPLALGLVGPDGADLPLARVGAADPGAPVVELRAAEETLVFADVPARPVPSLLRGFSAPVRLSFVQSDADLAFLLAHDSDPFNRWDAGFRLATQTLLAMQAAVAAGQSPEAPTGVLEAFARVLEDAPADPAFAAEVFALPSLDYLAGLLDEVDVDAVHRARKALRLALAERLEEPLAACYARFRSRGAYAPEPAAMARRRLANTALGYLMELERPEHRERCLAQYHEADNMTDVMGALAPLNHCPCPQRDEVLEHFYQRWQGRPLVVDKWFALNATSELPGTLERVTALLAHPAFDRRNPNRFRALVGAFAHANPVAFHHRDGDGYRFVADQVRALDPVNPQVAARLAGAFSRWRRHEPVRRGRMKAALEDLLATPDLSRDTYEVVSKSLAGG